MRDCLYTTEECQSTTTTTTTATPTTTTTKLIDIHRESGETRYRIGPLRQGTATHRTEQNAVLTPRVGVMVRVRSDASVALFRRTLNIKKVKERIAVNGTPSHSYGTSLATWDHTVLPATRHK